MRKENSQPFASSMASSFVVLATSTLTLKYFTLLTALSTCNCIFLKCFHFTMLFSAPGEKAKKFPCESGVHKWHFLWQLTLYLMQPSSHLQVHFWYSVHVIFVQLDHFHFNFCCFDALSFEFNHSDNFQFCIASLCWLHFACFLRKIKLCF